MIRYEIKTYRPADKLLGPDVDSYCYQVAYCRFENGNLLCQLEGGEGWFEFKDNFCPKFLGKYPAIALRILGEDEDSKSVYRQEPASI